MDGIGQYPTFITCDEAVYALAKEVSWSVKELDSVVLRGGGGAGRGGDLTNFKKNQDCTVLIILLAF